MTALIAHISDIHFGAVDTHAAQHLAEHINQLSPHGLIVTGDLTQAGRKHEFADAAAYLKSFAAPVLVVPGNHDVPVYNLGRRFADPWSRYRKHIHGDLAPTDEFGAAYVLGLNSARRAGLSFDWSRGRLSPSQITFASQALSQSERDFKIVALHHPVTPAPGKAGAAVINRADRALNAFAKAGADLVLTGHAHVAQADVKPTSSGAIVVAAAGTASSTRLRGEAPSYNLLRFEGDALSVETHRYYEGGFNHERRYEFVRHLDGWRRL